VADPSIRPANDVPWEDLQELFGSTRDTRCCQCQRWKIGRWEWTPVPVEDRVEQLRADVEEPPGAGLVAYLEGTPVGWCAVEPRVAYPLMLDGRSPVWSRGRSEDRDDGSVWAVTCFFTRPGFRRRGITAALAAAAVQHARAHGARAVEGYPMVTEPGKVVTWGELFVGSRSAFDDAGFVEVSRPTKRRVVMRVDLERRP